MKNEYYINFMKRRNKYKRNKLNGTSDIERLIVRCDVIIVKLVELSSKVNGYPSDFMKSLDRINNAAEELNNLCKRRRYEI